MSTAVYTDHQRMPVSDAAAQLARQRAAERAESRTQLVCAALETVTARWGLSDAELGAAIGVSRMSVNRWRRGAGTASDYYLELLTALADGELGIELAGADDEGNKVWRVVVVAD